MTTHNDSGSVEFVPARCPSCGGELRVPADRESVKCMYCGSDVILHDPTKVVVEPHIDVEKTKALAKDALDGKNYDEAYRYYTQVLEQNPNDSDAWLGKGYSAGLLSTLKHSRVDEMINCFDKALESGEGEEEEMKKMMRFCYLRVNTHYTSMWTAQLLENPNVSDNQRDKQNKNELKLLGKAYHLPEGYGQPSLSYSNGAIRNTVKKLIMGNLRIEQVGRPAGSWPSSEKLVEHRENLVESRKWWMDMYGGFDNLSDDPELNKFFNDYIEDAKDKKCYIATATLGDINNPEVKLLRRFRDDILSHSTSGRKLVKLYYEFSPIIADLIIKHDILRLVSLQLIVKPCSFIARKMLM